MATIEQTAELTALIEKQNKLYAAQGQMLKGQIGMMTQLQQVIKGMGFEERTSELGDFKDVLEEAVGDLEKYAGTTQGSMDRMSKAMRESEKQGGKLGGVFDKIGKKSKQIGVAAVALDGLKEGFDFSVNAATSFAGTLTTAIGALTNLAFSVITFPFKILQGLINMSEGGGGGGLREALEGIRKEFGSLKEDGAKAIIDISRSMKGQLAETGLATYRIFGNLAERLKTITEYATNMGNAFDLVRDSFVQNSERVGAYIKGLGLSEEGQAAFAETAIKSGKTLEEVGREVTTYAYQMGEAFGINGKQISRDVGNMMADVNNFGSLSVQTMTNVSVFARRLGVEFKALLGVVDQFDNFENAANSAAQLSQAFGLQLDTLQLLKAEDPAERIEMLRKSFFAAGRSVENMTRQERALLATQTGLDQKTAEMVFSLESQGKSYADIQKTSDATKKKQLSQAEAMEKLADSIERLVKSGSSGSGGFFDRFIQGFSKGIRRSGEFRELMRHLHKSLVVVERAGMQVGRAFVDAFPGVKDMLKALSEFFNPARFKKQMTAVIDIFKRFFKGGKGGLDLAGFQAELKTKFADFFNMDSPTGQKFKAGVKKFFLKLRDLFVDGIRIGFEGLKKGFDFIRNLIANPQEMMKSASRGGDSMSAFFMQEIFQPLYETITGPAGEELWDSFKSLMLTVFSRLGDWLGEFASQHKTEIIGGLLLVFAGPAIIAALARGLVATLGFGLAKGLSGAVRTGMSAARSMASKASEAGSATGQAGGALTGAQGASTAESVGALGRVVAAVNQARITPGTIVKMAAIGFVFGAMASGLAVGLGLLILAIREYNITPAEIGTAVLFMGGATLIAAALGGLVVGLAALGAAINPATAVAALLGAGAVAIAGNTTVKGMSGLVERVLAGPSLPEVTHAAEFVGTSALIIGALALILAELAAAGGITVFAGPLAFLGGAVLYKGMSGVVTLVQKAVEEFGGITVSDVVRVAMGIGSTAAIIGSLGLIGAELAAIGGGAVIGGIAAVIGAGALMAIMSGVPELARTAITTFGGISPSAIEETSVKIKAVSSILKSVASIGGTIATIGLNSMVDNIKGAFGAGSASGMASALTGMKDAVQQTILAANDINISDESRQKLEGVSAVLEVLKTFSEVLSNVAKATQPSMVESIVNIGSISRTAEAVSSVLASMTASINGFVSVILAVVANRSAEDMQKLQPVADLIGSLGTLMTNIVSATSSLPAEDGTEVRANLNRLATFMTQANVAMRNVFVGVTEGLMSIIERKSFDPDKFTAAAKAFSTVFTALSSLTKAMSVGATKAASNGGDSKSTAVALKGMMAGISDLFSGGTFMGQVSEVIESMAGIGDSLGEGKLKSISQFGTAVTSISSAMTEISKELTSLNDVSVQHVETGIVALVASINDIGDSIASIKGVDLNAELRGLVSRLGLEGRDTLRINHGNYNLTVNLKVTVDAEEFEKALLNRAGGTLLVRNDQ